MQDRYPVTDSCILFHDQELRGPITFDPRFGTVSGPDGKITLSVTQARIFGLLVKRKFVVFEVMYDFLYADRPDPPYLNTLNVHMMFLRKNLVKVGLGGLIKTLTRRGWKMQQKVETNDG